MPIAKKLTVTRRRRDFYVLRRKLEFELFCEVCNAERSFVSLADAVTASCATMRRLVQMIEAGELHFLESVGGHLFVCSKSLRDKLPKRISTTESDSIFK